MTPLSLAFALSLIVFGAGGLFHVHRQERAVNARRTFHTTQHTPLSRRPRP